MTYFHRFFRTIPGVLMIRLQSNNDGVWRCLYQLDRTLCDEVDGQKDADIPVTERTRVECVEPLKLAGLKLFLLLQVLHKIRQEKVKEFTWADIYRHLEQVIKTLFSLWRYDRAKKQLILETQLSTQFTWTEIYRHLKQHCLAFSLSSHLKMFAGTRSCALARVFPIRVSWVRRAKRCPSSGIF